MNRADYQSDSHRTASRRVSRAVVLLSRAEEQLQAASQTTPDKYGRERLRFLATGLRELSIPLSKIVTCFEKGRAAYE